MSRLIDENTIIKMLNTMDRYTSEELTLCDTDMTFPKNEVFIVDDVFEGLDELPSAQPKRGRWIKTARWGRVYYCDQCRNYLDFDGVNAGRGDANFCPNCGADMRKTDDA